MIYLKVGSCAKIDRDVRQNNTQKTMRLLYFTSEPHPLRHSDVAFKTLHMIKRTCDYLIYSPLKFTTLYILSFWSRYQDGMAIVRSLGKPSLFVTVTCKPAWEEVTRTLLPGQRPEDRPDVVARVFRLNPRPAGGGGAFERPPQVFRG